MSSYDVNTIKLKQTSSSIANSQQKSEVLLDSFTDYFVSKTGRWYLLLELECASLVFAISLTLASAGSWLAFSFIDLFANALYIGWIAIAFVAIVDYYHHDLNRNTPKRILIYCFFLLQMIIISSTAVLNIIFSLSGAGWEFFWQNLVQDLTMHISYGVFLGGFCLYYIYIKNQWLHKKNSELHYRVQAMQARIHPHFLFNSLNSVVSLITIDPEKAETMLIDLSRLFRASFQELRLVSLKEEITLCEQYLAIEQTRLGDRLRVQWKILATPDMLKRAKIPLLTLQPLLENSLLHGVEKINSNGVILILIEVVEQHVNIVISNPYQPNQEMTSKHRHNGIAVENVKQRLSAYYGSSLKFQIHEGEELYTTIFSYEYD